jgi:hypothetical protein
MSLHARRHTYLYDPDQVIQHGWRSLSRGWIYAIYFLAIGVVSLFSATISSYLPLGLIVLPFLLTPEEFSNESN